MTKIEYNNFGEYEGYVGNEKEFWFRKIVLNEVKCHENLRKIGICDNDIARSIKSATKFKRRFKGILTQLNVQIGIEEDLKKVAFCNNVNSKGGGDSVSSKSEYKEALKNAPNKLKAIISSMRKNKIVVCTCSDI